MNIIMYSNQTNVFTGGTTRFTVKPLKFGAKLFFTV